MISIVSVITSIIGTISIVLIIIIVIFVVIIIIIIMVCSIILSHLEKMVWGIGPLKLQNHFFRLQKMLLGPAPCSFKTIFSSSDKYFLGPRGRASSRRPELALPEREALSEILLCRPKRARLRRAEAHAHTYAGVFLGFLGRCRAATRGAGLVRGTRTHTCTDTSMQT